MWPTARVPISGKCGRAPEPAPSRGHALRRASQLTADPVCAHRRRSIPRFWIASTCRSNSSAQNAVSLKGSKSTLRLNKPASKRLAHRPRAKYVRFTDGVSAWTCRRYRASPRRRRLPRPRPRRQRLPRPHRLPRPRLPPIRRHLSSALTTSAAANAPWSFLSVRRTRTMAGRASLRRVTVIAISTRRCAGDLLPTAPCSTASTLAQTIIRARRTSSTTATIPMTAGATASLAASAWKTLATAARGRPSALLCFRRHARMGARLSGSKRGLPSTSAHPK